MAAPARRRRMARHRKPVNPPNRPEGHAEGNRMYEIAAQPTGELENNESLVQLTKENPNTPAPARV